MFYSRFDLVSRKRTNVVGGSSLMFGQRQDRD